MERAADSRTRRGPAGDASRGSRAFRSSFAPPRFRRRPVVWTAVVLAGLGLVGSLAVHYRPRPPLRVVVLRPVVATATPGAKESPEISERLSLAASGVLVASLTGLTSLEGLAPLDPTQAGASGPLAGAAREAAADEVLAATLEPAEGELARLTLRRVAADGRVLWAEVFEVPTAPGDLHLLADAVGVHLQRAYPDARRRAGTPDLEARDEDYAAFLEVRRRIDSGRSPMAPELVRLEEILRRSPRFLEASSRRRAAPRASINRNAIPISSPAATASPPRRALSPPTIPGRSPRSSVSPSPPAARRRPRRPWPRWGGCSREIRSSRCCGRASPRAAAGWTRRSPGCAPR